MKVILIKYIMPFIIIFVLGIFFEEAINSYKNILFSTNITILIVTLIAGLFGFMIAVIPFAIQLFNQDNTEKKNYFLNKLMEKEKFDFFIKPMFNRFTNTLDNMRKLFIYCFILNIIPMIDLPKITFLYEEILKISLFKICIITLLYIYLSLVVNFCYVKKCCKRFKSISFVFYSIKRK